jgi:hypothetical protein
MYPAIGGILVAYSDRLIADPAIGGETGLKFSKLVTSLCLVRKG